eukprot:6602234-Pyramimonas_sp.AAC.1
MGMVRDLPMGDDTAKLAAKLAAQPRYSYDMQNAVQQVRRSLLGLDTDAVESTLLSHLVTEKGNSPVRYLRMGRALEEVYPAL